MTLTLEILGQGQKVDVVVASYGFFHSIANDNADFTILHPFSLNSVFTLLHVVQGHKDINFLRVAPWRPKVGTCRIFTNFCGFNAESISFDPIDDTRLKLIWKLHYTMDYNIT